MAIAKPIQKTPCNVWFDRHCPKCQLLPNYLNLYI